VTAPALMGIGLGLAGLQAEDAASPAR
jgi:hypothetical protein